jgi:hypothetical protein
MGMADAIVDLVSSGTTLRENNLKEIEGGVVLQSQVSLLFLMHEQAHTCPHQGLKNWLNLPKFGGFGGGRFFKNWHCSCKNLALF